MVMVWIIVPTSYMRTWKPHYYEADYAFYNFPYAFGYYLQKDYMVYIKNKVLHLLIRMNISYH